MRDVRVHGGGGEEPGVLRVGEARWGDFEGFVGERS